MAAPRNPRKDAVTDDDQAFEAAAPGAEEADTVEEQDALTKSGMTKDAFREARTKAYAAGAKRLREENLEQFRRLVKEEASKLGIEYVFQPTEQEKAKAQVEALLAAHPELREQLTQ